MDDHPPLPQTSSYRGTESQWLQCLAFFEELQYFGNVAIRPWQLLFAQEAYDRLRGLTDERHPLLNAIPFAFNGASFELVCYSISQRTPYILSLENEYEGISEQDRTSLESFVGRLGRDLMWIYEDIGS